MVPRTAAFALLLLSVLYCAASLPAAYGQRLRISQAALTNQQPLGNITQVAANNNHLCALTKEGEVKCWGANDQGQLGDGSTSYRSQAVAVPGLSGPATAIITGAEHSCAVINGKAIECWGGNDAGQLGNGTTTSSTQPVATLPITAAVTPPVTGVVAGAYHTCAIVGGGVFCWGNNEFGQLGDGSTQNHARPTPVSSLNSTVIALAAGDYHTCGLLTTGEVRCWGQNTAGQLGNSSRDQQATPVTVNNLPRPVIALSAGWNHTCAILASGEVTSGELRCWGANADGQLGDGTTNDQTTPVTVVGLNANVLSVTGGGQHTCALQATTDGTTAFCWGSNWNGALGDGTTNGHHTPIAVIGLRAGVTALAAGAHSTCALVETVAGAGRVQCWGVNRAGQLGDGTLLYRAQPTLVSDLPPLLTAVSAGGEHSCAIQGEKLLCWGANGYWQLGVTDRGYSTRPIAVNALSTAIQAVDAGKNHTCAITTPGSLFCWGNNWIGQLGNGTTQQSTVTAVSTLNTGVTALAVGDIHTCAIKQGNAYCWGANWDGRLGDGTQTGRLTPVAVQGLPALAAAIDVGQSHSCGLTVAGALFCWGYNGAGQLGDGTTVEQHSPIAVIGLPGAVTALALGAAHSCALVNQPTQPGRVYCWGTNRYGQLGDSTTQDRLTPVAVQGLPAPIQAITAAADHTCALTTAGGVYCWGANRYGQLGDSTTQDRLTPVAVSNLSNGVVQIAAGAEHTCARLNNNSTGCWGLDTVGQLGSGLERWRSTPGDVVEAVEITVTPTGIPTGTPTTTATATLLPTPEGTATPSTPTDGDAFENDDNCATASRLSTDGQVQNHTFHQADDQDWVQFTVTAGITYTIEADVPAPSPADLILALYAQCNSGALQTQDYAFSPDVRLTFTAATSGVYYLRLRNQQSTLYGATVTYQLAVRTLTTQSLPGALIIVAGRQSEGDPLQTQIHNVTNRVYRLWRNQGYPADRIRYLATDQNLDPDRDGRADVSGLPDQDNLRTAITQWAVDKVGKTQALTLYFVDHGGYDILYLDEPRRERLTPQMLDQWLSQLESAAPGVKITIFVEACNAGSFIDPEQSISKPGRIVITSAGAYELAWATNNGAAFSDLLLDGLALGKSLLGAFYEARASTNLGLMAQTPWLDDDGDRIPNDPDDGALAAQSHFRTIGSLSIGDSLWQPYIVWGEVRRVPPTGRRDGVVSTTAEIWAEIRDDHGVQTVLAVIYPPAYQPPASGEELVTGPPPITLQARGADRYAGAYDFSEIGDYQIFIYALDSDGLHSPPKAIRFSNGSRLFLPLINR